MKYFLVGLIIGNFQRVLWTLLLLYTPREWMRLAGGAIERTGYRLRHLAANRCEFCRKPGIPRANGAVICDGCKEGFKP